MRITIDRVAPVTQGLCPAPAGLIAYLLRAPDSASRRDKANSAAFRGPNQRVLLWMGQMIPNDPDDDALAPARGIINVITLGVLFWILIISTIIFLKGMCG